MKKTSCILALLLSMLLPMHGKAQSDEAQQLLLNVEKLAQLKSILSDMEKGYEIVYKGYGTIRDISEGSFSLHETFLDQLLAVSPAVRCYKRIADIILLQRRLVSEYKSAYNRFRRSGTFSPAELDYLAAVYASLLKESLRHLDELTLVITAGELRMNDEERLEAIDRLFAEMEDKLVFLRHFNRQTSLLSLQRLREQHETDALEKLHGLN